MSSRNVEVAKRWYQEVWNEKKPQIIHELMTPETIAHLTSGTTVGPDGFKPFWDQLNAAFSDIHMTIEDTVAEGDKVALRWRISLKHTGPDLGVAPTNKTVRFSGMSWLIIREGKILEGWDAWDSLDMMVTIGAASVKNALLPEGA